MIGPFIAILSCSGSPCFIEQTSRKLSPNPSVQRKLDQGASVRLSFKQRELTYRSAYAEALRLGDRFGEDRALSGLSYCLWLQGKNKEALAESDRALAIGRSSKDMFGEAYAAWCQGQAERRVGQKQKALDLYAQVLPVFKEVGDKDMVARVLNNWASIYDDLGQKQKALDLYAHALPVFREVGDKDMVAGVLNGQASIYSALGQKQKALDLYAQALPVFKEVGDKDMVAGVLNGQAGIYDDLGQKQKALDLYAQVLPVFKEVGNKDMVAGVLNGQAGIYDDLGQKQKALDLYAQALPVFREVGDKDMVAGVLNGQAGIYDALGQKQKSLDLYAQALPVFKEVGDKDMVASVLTGQAGIYDDLGQKQKALDLYAQALPVFKEVGNKDMVAGVLNGQAGIYSDLGQKQKAQDLYAQALPVFKEVGDKDMVAGVLNNQAIIYDALGQKQKALARCSVVLPIAREVGDRALENRVLSLSSQVLYSQGARSAAIGFGKLAVNVVQGLRRDISGLDKQARDMFRNSVSREYHRLADWLAEAGRIAEAEQVLQLLKDEEFYSFLRRRAAPVSEAIELTPREKSWSDTYTRLGDRLAALSKESDELKKKGAASTPAENAKKEQLRTILAEAETAFQAFLSNLRDALGKASNDSRQDQIFHAEEIQSTLKKLPGTVAVYTIVSSDGVWLLDEFPGLNAVRRPKSMIKAADLNKLILQFQDVLQRPDRDPRPLGSKLYELLIRPIEADLKSFGARRVVWSLDGSLRYVPLWALYDNQTGLYLLQKYPSSLFTPRTADRMIENPGVWSGAEFGVSSGGQVGKDRFSALAGVKDELDAVHQVLGGPELLDENFTSMAFRNVLDSSPKVLHVATHFRFTAGDEDHSFLVLGAGKSMSVKDLRDLPGDAFAGVDLLTLSACQTAVGGDGSEFESFALLAQQKGAGAVLATLWPVEDRSTALLMGEFYRIRKQHPEITKLEALVRAQTEMIEGKPMGSSDVSPRSVEVVNPQESSDASLWPKNMPTYAHPYYWAPFVLTGNWK